MAFRRHDVEPAAGTIDHDQERFRPARRPLQQAREPILFAISLKTKGPVFPPGLSHF
jgi:hypothetical protein